MTNEQQGRIVSSGAILGLLTGIVLSFVFKSSPLIGDCGTDVEINTFYLYVGLFAVKVLLTTLCTLGGTIVGVVVMGLIELGLYIKKVISNIGTASEYCRIQYVHRKYNYRYFVDKTVDILSEPYSILIVWAIGIDLFVVGLIISPEICYISNKTRTDFILSTALTVTGFSLLVGWGIYKTVKKFRIDILKYLLGVSKECDDLDSITCSCRSPELAEILATMFDKDAYSLEGCTATLKQVKDGETYYVNFRLYIYTFGPFYSVEITNYIDISREDVYHGYTLRQVVKETLKVCKKHIG